VTERNKREEELTLGRFASFLGVQREPPSEARLPTANRKPGQNHGMNKETKKDSLKERSKTNEERGGNQGFFLFSEMKSQQTGDTMVRESTCFTRY
jgi:hypothetical protein